LQTHGSGVLARGVLVDGITASSKAGRFLLDKEREVLAALHKPTPAQLLLVTSFVRGEWTLYQQEQRVMNDENPSRHNLRLLHGLRAQQDRTYERLFGSPRLNRGLSPAPEPIPPAARSLADIEAEIAA
jgi:hypothetical protein